MREFEDLDGVRWETGVSERESPDYKGRFHLTMRSEATGEVVELTDVRWNSRRTAERTLDTMSVVELRRRLRSARGRARQRV
ncbi:MAG: hypothetical protein RQ745_13870 [Longimicrobiales bacterium]|nr:hypothetical protein [Longimicrobiales bacterium]